MRRSLLVAALVTLMSGTQAGQVWAHAGLRSSNPRDGVRLGDTPAQVALSFNERPDAALSSIRVLDSAGAACHVGAAQAVPGDPLSLSIPVRVLKPGVYIVHWRIVSAVDGHVTAGSYAFGVRVSPGGASAAASNAYPSTSRHEVAGRAILILGLIIVLGAAVAALGGFGGPRAIELVACGWLVAISGLAIFAAAQMRNTGAGAADLLRSSIGRALVWRAAALGVAAVSLAAACAARRRKNSGLQFGAMVVVAVAALTAIGAHVIAGHAAAVPRVAALAIAAQALHFAAAGIWAGGLAALMLAVRGEPGLAKTQAVRRFSAVAAAALVLVTITGTLRALEEIPTWKQAISASYGQAVMIKALLLVAIAAFGARNRWHSVPAAASTLRPLRRTASVEMTLMIAAVAVAGALGALPPPAAGLVEVGTIDVSGADFATSVRAALTAASDQPGPNRFAVHVADYDSRTPIRDARVSLRFTPVDDRGIAPTSLPLEPAPGDSYAGSGSNLSFDGRWKVVVLVERAGTSTEVPLDVEVRGAPLPVTRERTPAGAPRYNVTIKGEGTLWIDPDSERPGPARLHITSLDMISEYRPLDDIVVTSAAGAGPVRQLAVRRIDRSTFTVDVDFQTGVNTIVVVARGANGGRVRAAVDINVPPH